jgi:hypothetical protein
LFCAILSLFQNLNAQDYTFTTFAGVAPGDSGRVFDGVGIASRFYAPNSVAVDSVGNVYVAASYTRACIQTLWNRVNR